MAVLRFSKDHVWVKGDGDVMELGITSFAQKQLKDIVFIDLPETGEEIGKGERLASIESVKTVSDILSPVSGRIVEINSAVDDDCSILNDSPKDTWIAKIELSKKKELDSLLSEEDYRKISS